MGASLTPPSQLLCTPTIWRVYVLIMLLVTFLVSFLVEVSKGSFPRQGSAAPGAGANGSWDSGREGPGGCKGGEAGFRTSLLSGKMGLEMGSVALGWPPQTLFPSP